MTRNSMATMELVFAALCVASLGACAEAFIGDVQPNPVPIHPLSPPTTSRYDVPFPYAGTSVTAALITMKPKEGVKYNARFKDLVDVDIAGQGPVLWSVSRWNQGDLSPRIAPRHPFSQVNLGTAGGGEGYSTDDPRVFSAQAWRPDIEKGVMLATAAMNGPKWNDDAPQFYATVACVTDSQGFGYSMKTGQFGNSNPNLDVTVGKAGQMGEGNADVAVAWFPYDQGWTAGYIDAPPEYSKTAEPKWATPSAHSPDLPQNLSLLVQWSERGARLELPGVDAFRDGMLFLTSTDPGKSNNDLNVMGVYTRHWGKGWRVQAREDSSDDPKKLVDSSEHMFAFLYVPFTAAGLIGGNVGPDGGVVRGVGDFSVRRVSQGTYAVSIGRASKKPSDGVLVLQVTGRDDKEHKYAQHAFLSYNYTEDGPMIVESHQVQYAGRHGGDAASEETFPFVDAAFSFLWLDFVHPLTPEPDMFTGRLLPPPPSWRFWVGFLFGMGLSFLGLLVFLLKTPRLLASIPRLSFSLPTMPHHQHPLIPSELEEEELLRGPYQEASQ